MSSKNGDLDSQSNNTVSFFLKAVKMVRRFLSETLEFPVQVALLFFHLHAVVML